MARIFTLTTAILLSGCVAVHYQSREFDAMTRDHRTIAVAPFEMVFSGKIPAGLDAESILAIEESESVAFQHALYNRLLNRSSDGRRRPILIDIQPVDETNRRLARHGVGVRESWTMPTERLAAVLGVDAVVRTRVRKTRYLSDLASWGLGAGIEIAHHEANAHLEWLLPAGLTKTYDIWAECQLAASDEVGALWKIAVHRATDWQRPANDVVYGVTRRLARKFPYRAVT